MGDLTDIRDIIQKVTAEGLVRHINGNTLDNRVRNLAWVSPREAFENKTWQVDAICTLTQA